MKVDSAESLVVCYKIPNTDERNSKTAHSEKQSFIPVFFLHVASLQTCFVQGLMSAEMSAQIDWLVSCIKWVGSFTFPSHPLLIRKAVR